MGVMRRRLRRRAIAAGAAAGALAGTAGDHQDEPAFAEPEPVDEGTRQESPPYAEEPVREPDS